jgi:putative FmdB family regulatory protein
MATYNYGCKDCDSTFEVTHPMAEKPIVLCPSCKSHNTSKRPSLVGLVVKSPRSLGQYRAFDQIQRDAQMRAELRQDLGIEKISPLQNSTMKEVYTDAKAQASYIKESMAAQAERKAAENKIKQREWTRKALLRTPQRAAEKKERRAAEEQKKRAIRI